MIRAVAVALCLLFDVGPCLAAGAEGPASPTGDDALAWRGVRIGMSSVQAATRLRELGLVPRRAVWGGKQRMNWEGSLSGLPPAGECDKAGGSSCEQVHLSLVRHPDGRAVVWGIAVDSFYDPATPADAVIDPLVTRYGKPGVTRSTEASDPAATPLPNAGWRGEWYPNGSRASGDVVLWMELRPRAGGPPRGLPAPLPDRGARTSRSYLSIGDNRLYQQALDAHDEADRKLASPAKP